MSGIAIDPDTFAEFERSGWEDAAEAYDAFWASLTGRVAERGGTIRLSIKLGSGRKP